LMDLKMLRKHSSDSWKAKTLAN